jgi:hypothetical protein
MLPWRRGVGSFLALAAFVAVVTLTIANHNVRRARRPSRVALASYTGEHLTSFFRGLRPVPAYVNGKIYPPNRASLARRSGCGKVPGVLSRVAAMVGLEKVVHAQNNGICQNPTNQCFGCRTRMEYFECPGGCEGGCHAGVYGGACASGNTIIGPACGADGGCGCDEATCYNTPQNCGCQ